MQGCVESTILRDACSFQRATSFIQHFAVCSHTTVGTMLHAASKLQPVDSQPETNTRLYLRGFSARCCVSLAASALQLVLWQPAGLTAASLALLMSTSVAAGAAWSAWWFDLGPGACCSCCWVVSCRAGAAASLGRRPAIAYMRCARGHT
jgi:hypothetical protein